jgi:hypothetical protein
MGPGNRVSVEYVPVMRSAPAGNPAAAPIPLAIPLRAENLAPFRTATSARCQAFTGPGFGLP